MSIDTFGGRKVVAAAIVMVLAVGAVLIKGDVPPGFLQLLQVVFGAFVLGNGIEHVTDAYAANAAVPPPQDAPAPMVADNSPVLEQLHHTQEAVATVQSTLIEIIKKIWPAQP